MRISNTRSWRGKQRCQRRRRCQLGQLNKMENGQGVCCVNVCVSLVRPVLVRGEWQKEHPSHTSKMTFSEHSPLLKIPQCSKCIPQDTRKSEPYFQIADKKPLRVAVGTFAGERTLSLCHLITRLATHLPPF